MKLICYIFFIFSFVLLSSPSLGQIDVEDVEDTEDLRFHGNGAINKCDPIKGFCTETLLDRILDKIVDKIDKFFKDAGPMGGDYQPLPHNPYPVMNPNVEPYVEPNLHSNLYPKPNQHLNPILYPYLNPNINPYLNPNLNPNLNPVIG